MKSSLTSLTPEERLTIEVVLHATLALDTGRMIDLRSIGVSVQCAQRLSALTARQMLQMARSRHLFANAMPNPTVMDSILTLVEKDQCTEDTQQALVQHAAPLPMMTEIYGLGPSDYSALRRKVGVVGPPGRPRTLSDRDDLIAWNAWGKAAEEPTLPARYLAVAQLTRFGLSTLWPLLRQWTIEAGMTVSAGTQEEARHDAVVPRQSTASAA